MGNDAPIQVTGRCPETYGEYAWYVKRNSANLFHDSYILYHSTWVWPGYVNATKQKRGTLTELKAHCLKMGIAAEFED